MIPMPMIVAEQLGAVYAVRLLLRELGAAAALKVLAGVVVDQIKGEPWRGMNPTADTKEALSRRQIGGAVILERRLRSVVSPDKARALNADVVKYASVEFLKRNIPQLNKSDILSMPNEKRDAFLFEINEKFFNSDAEFELHGEESLDLRITRCRFVELLAAIGEADMAPVFCEGDGEFFTSHQDEIILDRPEKLSTGGKICDFRFRWK
jgi:hypothetical protein